MVCIRSSQISGHDLMYKYLIYFTNQHHEYCSMNTVLCATILKRYYESYSNKTHLNEESVHAILALNYPDMILQ